MKIAYFKYDSFFGRYFIIEEGRSDAMELYILHGALSPVQYLEENVSQDDKSTLIWSDDSFKEMKKKDFESWQEEQAFEKEYSRYYNKRWNEMPQVDLSNEDYAVLKQQWEGIRQRKPNYLIFELDNSTPLDKVTIIEKEELSEQDYLNMYKVHQEYLRWDKAKEKYMKSQSDYSYEIWRGPQDDEYDADIAQFLDKE